MRRTALLIVFLAVRYASAQDNSSLVTFYSTGCKPPCANQPLAHVAGSAEAAYIGNIYDGPDRLAHLSSLQFLTFKLPSGAHSFGVAKKPTKQQLNAKLVPGKHYFIRATILVGRGVLNFRSVTPSLDLVDCSVAASESGNLKPVKPSKLKVTALSELVMTPGFPACEVPK
jgi:hypothetical protein